MKIKRPPVLTVNESDPEKFQAECRKLVEAGYRLGSAYHAVFVDRNDYGNAPPAAKFESLNGKTLTKVENENNEKLIFTTADGEVYELFHDQDCCEEVTIEDICGDLDDLLGEPLLMAEEVVNEDRTRQESCTWTFYKLGTRKGTVTVRWYGESNGYYSESVDFRRVT